MMTGTIRNSASPASYMAAGTATGASAPVNEKMWKAATDFESMTIGQMLQPMFDTVDTSKGIFGGGIGESNFRPMLTTEMAKQIEKNGGFGLAPAVYRKMLEMQENAK